MWQRIFVATTIIVIFNFFSCSSGIKLQFQQPAQDHLIGIKWLVVAPCTDTDEATLMCNFITTFIQHTNYFDLFDRDSFSKALEQNDLSYDNIRQGDSLNQIGKLLDIDGIIFSELKILKILPDEQGIDKIEKLVWTGEYERDEDGKIIMEVSPSGEKNRKKKFKLQTVDQHYRIRKAKIEAIFQLIDLQKGSIVISRESTENYRSDKIIEEESQKLPTDDEIKRKLILYVVQNFLNEIAPKVVKVKRIIETGNALIDSGEVHAKAGRWDDAKEIWNRAEKIYPYDARVYYNLGVACEAQGDYELAEIYYQKALLLSPKKKLYQKAVQNIRKIWQEK